ncbi:hypothetical protein C922_05868, partial [Plasmodium inui San Antonio 1]
DVRTTASTGLSQWLSKIEGGDTEIWGKALGAGNVEVGLKNAEAPGIPVKWSELIDGLLRGAVERAPSRNNIKGKSSLFWAIEDWAGLSHNVGNQSWQDNNWGQKILGILFCIVFGLQHNVSQDLRNTLHKVCPDCGPYDISGWLSKEEEDKSLVGQYEIPTKSSCCIKSIKGSQDARITLTGGALGVYLQNKLNTEALRAKEQKDKARKSVRSQLAESNAHKAGVASGVKGKRTAGETSNVSEAIRGPAARTTTDQELERVSTSDIEGSRTSGDLSEGTTGRQGIGTAGTGAPERNKATDPSTGVAQAGEVEQGSERGSGSSNSSETDSLTPKDSQTPGQPTSTGADGA